MKQSNLSILKRLRDDFPYYAQKCLKIVDKETGQIVPFKFNRAQLYIHQKIEEQKKRTGRVRVVIIKGRQQGCSTYVAGRYFHQATLNPGSTVFILAHIAESTNHLFGMAKKYYENAPPPILPTIDKMNERRLEFNSINSSYSVGTAGSAQIGRGTTVRFFHGSEVGFWEKAEDIASGVLQAVPKAADTEVILESTANVPGDYFHRRVLEGLDPDTEGDFLTLFVPWFWQDEYRRPPREGFVRTEEEEELHRLFGLDDAQLSWRRVCIIDEFHGDTWRFQREYPNTVEEGFLASGANLVKASYVIDARKCKIHDPGAAVIGGCDPARTRDRTVMILRQGREIISVKKYSTMDEMTCAGIIANEIDRRNVLKYFVDVGCGYGTVDRLKELGYGGIVMGVHFGARPLEDEIFTNKRAEMADAVRSWFEEGGVNIPDDDAFQADIVSIPPLKERGSRGKLGLPPKDEIKKLLGRSTDIFDALCLTFAYPVARGIQQRKITRAPFDVRRPNSPLSTVRDFNNTASPATKTHTSTFKIK